MTQTYVSPPSERPCWMVLMIECIAELEQPQAMEGRNIAMSRCRNRPRKNQDTWRWLQKRCVQHDGDSDLFAELGDPMACGDLEHGIWNKCWGCAPRTGGSEKIASQKRQIICSDPKMEPRLTSGPANAIVCLRNNFKMTRPSRG